MLVVLFLEVLITANDEKLRDPEGYEAITQLHHQMDDDQSGSIDRFESTDVSCASSTYFYLFLKQI